MKTQKNKTQLYKRISVRISHGKGYKSIAKELGLTPGKVKHLVKQGKIIDLPEPDSIKQRRICGAMATFEKPDNSFYVNSSAAPISQN